MSRGSYCVVLTCSNNKVDKPELAFFTLPKDMNLAKKWIEFSGRKDIDLSSLKRYTMCSEHFTKKQFRFTYPRIILERGSIPHMNGPSSDIHPESGSDVIMDENSVDEAPHSLPQSNIAGISEDPLIPSTPATAPAEYEPVFKYPKLCNEGTDNKFNISNNSLQKGETDISTSKLPKDPSIKAIEDGLKLVAFKNREKCLIDIMKVIKSYQEKEMKISS